MSNVLGSIFLGSVKAYASAVLSAQLEIIKANNPPEFYEELLKAGDNFFLLLQRATKNKIVTTASQIFTEPIEQAAADDNIIL